MGRKIGKFEERFAGKISQNGSLAIGEPTHLMSDQVIESAPMSAAVEAQVRSKRRIEPGPPSGHFEFGLKNAQLFPF